MRRLIRSSEIFAQIIMLTFLSGITFWSIYTAFEALRESPWWFVAVTFFILLGFAILIYQGLELIARITDLPYPHAHHIDGLEVQSLTPLTAEMLDRIALHEGVSPGLVGTVIANEEVDDWGSLHEIVEEYHSNVRFGGDGQ
jgi:ABC-type transport system involved in multi-copper enzyme maturation permease subunit